MFPVFREARRLREASEHALLMLISLTSVVAVTMISCFILGLNIDYLDEMQLLFILVVSIPLSAVSCLARPTDNSIM